ncbi:hypothetical protein [Embleya sp. NPDC005575]|uniref:hypothetical protein n=1 Tax=Embleya sp. NPDC005575 TaxID=3156892 RepID=UPI0033B40709
MPEPFTPEWGRIDGVTVTGRTVEIDPAVYFFRYQDPTWLVVDWDLLARDLLPLRDTDSRTVEQAALEFVKEHGRITDDPAEVLRIGHKVAAHVFSDKHLTDPGLSHVDAGHMRMLREATTLMALNKVRIDGSIANVGPCWFFPVATSVVFGLDDEQGMALDELYHGGFFNEYRRIDSILAHAALGGRLVHGCSAAADMKGGAVVPYGADMDRFRADLEGMSDTWMNRIRAHAA